MKTLDDVMAGFSPARRAKVEARAAELVGEEMALANVRKALDLTQEQMARSLNIGQESISRLERRSDMLLSTLRSYVEAMGGDMEIVARFPQGSVVIGGLGDVHPQIQAAPRRRHTAASNVRKPRPTLVHASD